MAASGGPAVARLHKDRAAALFAAGKLDGAIGEYRRAVVAAPDDTVARKKLAELLVKQGRAADAVAQYQQLVGRLAIDGQCVQAIALCKVILGLAPDHRETQATLAALYARREGGAESWMERLPRAMSGALRADQRGGAGRRAGALELADVEGDPFVLEGSAASAELSTELPTIEPEPEPASAPDAGPGVEPAKAALEPELEPEVDIDVSTLPRTPLVSELPREVLVALLERVQLKTVAAGEAVIREGDAGGSMFVLAAGRVQVVREHAGEPLVMAELGEGTFFGEIGLVAEVPRLATVVAAEESVVLEVSRALLAELASAFPGTQALVQRFYKDRLLDNLLRASPLFRLLDDAQRTAVAERFAVKNVPAGTVLLQQGTAGTGLHVLLRGRCAVSVDESGGKRSLPVLHEGAVFGEISLLQGCRVTATVRALGPCLLLVLDPDTFAAQVLTNAEAAAHLRRLAEQRMARTERTVDESAASLLTLV